MFALRPLSSVVLVTGTLAGCKSDRPADSPTPAATADAPAGGPTVVTVTANDFSFDAPGVVPAGMVTMRLVNNGLFVLHTQRRQGDPRGQGYGAAVRGNAPATATATDLPAHDVVIKLVDYDFQISEPLAPGKRTILVENDGPQPHEVALLRLAPGKTVADFAAWDAGGMKGPPPAEPIGGVVALDKGARASFTADLSAGEYGLLCFVPDTKDGKPHLAHGMIKTIKVG